ncbi:hypothetical protein WR25_17802 [Diploscapter pachys]|uniref:Deltamethrin resistance protein prag01 domain-containing protein n=1 Tax=Diploscapter pachys TaxID=2018661 RepID=A0A2A2KNH5_9BILA|nr:hypothetical protein WR25_17802 [Diploscapter pachys]
MNRLIVQRFASLRRVLQTPKRNAGGGHHDAPHNPGPPATLDYMPIPCEPWAKVHGELQAKWNVQLAAAVALFTCAIGTALYTNLWIIPEISAPESWRYRNKPGYNYVREV